MKTSLTKHVENDPLYECRNYDTKYSYNECIDKEMEVKEIDKTFYLLGFFPVVPWMCSIVV